MLINGNKGITFGKLKIDLHSVSVCKGLLVAKGRRLGLNFRIDADCRQLVLLGNLRRNRICFWFTGYGIDTSIPQPYFFLTDFKVLIHGSPRSVFPEAQSAAARKIFLL